MEESTPTPMKIDLAGSIAAEAEHAARHVAALRDQLEDLSPLGSVAAVLRDSCADLQTPAAQTVADKIEKLAIADPTLDAMAPLVSELMSLCQDLRKRERRS